MFGFGLLAGCGGSSSPTLNGAQRNPANTVLAIGAMTQLGTGTTGYSAPLGKGTIDIYDFSTGAKLDSVSGATDAVTGIGKVSAVPGFSVVVVVKGTLGTSNTPYRLSTIIPTVPVANGSFTLGPDTTLAAEALGAKFFKTGTGIDSKSWATVNSKATTSWQALPAAQQNISLGGGLLNANSSYASNHWLRRTRKSHKSSALFPPPSATAWCYRKMPSI